MSCQYHPNYETLIRYSAGKIAGLERVMVRLHCKVCSACQQAVNELDTLGGSSLVDLNNTAVEANAFQKLMQRIQGNTESVQKTDDRSDYLEAIEKILARDGKADKLNWHWRTKRFAEIPLPSESDKVEAKLIYFKKGMKVPKHTHRDKEYTLVLSGAFSDNEGEYKRGDYILKSSHDEHSPVATSDCICLAITTQPLKFTGTFGPVLNWFLN